MTELRTLILIAWRNIWRSKARSWTVIGSIAVGLWAGLFVTAFTWGMYEQHLKDVVNNQLGHFQIHTPAFKADPAAIHHIPDAQQVLKSVQAVPGVTAAGRVLVEAMIASPGGNAGTVLCGVNPTDERLLTQLPEKITEGAYLTDSSVNGIVISERVCKKLKVHLKSKVVVTFQASDSNLVSSAYRVMGIFRTGDSAFDEKRCYVSGSELSARLGRPDVLHEITGRLSDAAALQSTVETLRRSHPDLTVETWLQLAPELRFVVESLNQYMYILIGVILLALMFGIVNTMLMAVLERTREFGMLMAIGLNKPRLFSIVMLETMFLALVGAPLGLLLAWLVTWQTHQTGIDLSAFSKGMASYGFDPVVRPSLNTSQYPKVALLAMITALISAIYPALKATRLHPAEAMRKT